METKSSEPIRLTEGQTELLTKALLGAAEQAAQPKAYETEIATKPLAKPAAATPPSNRSAKKPMVI
jgi:hypothetical protein